MKLCASPICGRPVDKKNGKWCSKDCAPYARLEGAEKGIKPRKKTVANDKGWYAEWQKKNT